MVTAGSAGLRTRVRRAGSQLLSLLQPRRFQVYGVGTAKSGTHSLARLFQRSYKAAHEPQAAAVIGLVLARAAGELSEAGFAAAIRHRDRALGLELDSSQLNYYLLDPLLEAFPDAKFVLTIRDCYSWLESFINHQLARPANGCWLELRDHRFGSGGWRYAEQERILEQHGLYTLDGYLSYWATHNREVIAKIPPDRLLVVRTHEISARVDDIAAFAGVAPETLDRERSHAFQAKRRFEVLSKVERAFLDGKVRRHAGDLMEAYFPDRMPGR